MDLDNTDTPASDSDVEPTRHEKTLRPRREPLEQDDNGPDSSADDEPAAVASRRPASVKRKRMSRRETECYLKGLGMTQIDIEFSRLYKSLILKGQPVKDKIRKAYNLRKQLTKAHNKREMANRKRAKLTTDTPGASLCDSEAASSNESEMKMYAGASTAPQIAFPSAAAAATSSSMPFRYATTSVSSSGCYSAQMDDASEASPVATSPDENPDAIVFPRNSSCGDTSRRSSSQSSHAFPCVGAATSSSRSARCPRSRNQLAAKTAFSSAPSRTATAWAEREEDFCQLVTLAKVKEVLKAGKSGRFFVRVRRFSACVLTEQNAIV